MEIDPTSSGEIGINQLISPRNTAQILLKLSRICLISDRF